MCRCVNLATPHNTQDVPVRQLGNTTQHRASTWQHHTTHKMCRCVNLATPHNTQDVPVRQLGNTTQHTTPNDK